MIRFSNARQFFGMWICAAMSIAYTCSSGLADDWLHWRGPDGNGVAKNATPPEVLDLNSNLDWKVSVPGRGSSSPIIVGDQIFLTSAVQASRGGNLDFTVWSFDKTTGQVNWSTVVNSRRPYEGTHSTNGYASASCCSDGEALFAFFGSYGLFCLDFSGTVVWNQDLGAMQTRNQFGEGASPTLYKDSVLVPWDHEGQSSLYRISKRSGETIWKVQRDEPTNWGTPVVFQSNGKSQVICTGQNFVRSYDFDSGEELWRCSGQTARPAASPVLDQQLVYVGSGFRGSFMAAFDGAGRGDIGQSEHVHWSIQRDTPDIASPVLYDGKIYFYKGKSGLLTCVDAKSGRPFYKTARIPELGSIYASPLAADGKLYLSDRDGTVVVIKAGEQADVISVNQLGETIDATPAATGSQLIIRGEQSLFSFTRGS